MSKIRDIEGTLVDFSHELNVLSPWGSRICFSGDPAVAATLCPAINKRMDLPILHLSPGQDQAGHSDTSPGLITSSGLCQVALLFISGPHSNKSLWDNLQRESLTDKIDLLSVSFINSLPPGSRPF
ncbi:hypothetical protein RRG08_018849 [Elysia crispata]|uniref:Uncharacterized protein n=1 Tax=Elysia crispata TaxID=231223 RepID=A0AAE1B6D2_9GAST|nr:hypothetical protein RRG08_018849 [Elysia crispata]